MAIKLINVLCEGPHDVAFLNRILKTIGFKSKEALKIGEYPAPMGDFFKQGIVKTKVEELNFQEIRRVLIPSNTLEKNNTYLFLYSMGGDGKKEERKDLLVKILDFLPEEGEFSKLPKGTKLGLIYFFDADNKGIKKRIEELNKELKEDLALQNVFQNNGEIKKVKRIILGNFIFTGKDGNTGDLESIIRPMMELGNEAIFNDARIFLQNHHDANRQKKLKITKADGKLSEKRDGKLKYDEEKSLIGVVGQLQNSGKANSSIIADCDFIALEKVQKNKKCQEILDFFDKI